MEALSWPEALVFTVINIVVWLVMIVVLIRRR